MKNIISIINVLENWISPKGVKRVSLFLLVISLQILVYKIVYITGGVKYAYSHVMYMTMILGALFFGVFGGFIFGVSGGIILGPYMPLDTRSMEMQEMLNRVTGLASIS